jgi:outer membrane receptor for ferrienterochelin and colicins
MPKEGLMERLALTKLAGTGLCAVLALFQLATSSSANEGSSGAEELLWAEIPSVLTASKKQESIQEAPAIVTVITSEEIKDFGASTFYDVLQRLPSIQPVGTHLYPRNTAVIRGDLRGPYDNHVLILLNGRPFRDDISGGLNSSLYNSFPVEIIDRIEYVRGPGSVLYGSDAFDGVINIITKTPTKDTQAEVTAGAGSFGALIGKGTVGAKRAGLEVVATVNYFNDDGWDYSAVTFFPATGSTTSGSTQYSKSNTSGSVFLRYSGFTFHCYMAGLKLGNSGLVPVWESAGTDGQSWLELDRRFADIGYSKEFPGGRHLQANVTYNYCIFESYNRDALSSSEGAHDILGEVSFSGAILKKVNYLVGGVAANMQNESIDKAKIAGFNSDWYSAYTQVDCRPTDKLKLVGGAQYNKPEHVDGVVVPRIGGMYHFSDALGAKVSYAQAFRSPWPVETQTDFPGVLVGNPSLKPEMVTTTDAQLLYTTPTNQSSLSLFDASYADLITRVPHPEIANTSTYVNEEKMELQGVEAEAKVLLCAGVYVEGSATYQHEVDNKVLTPTWIVKAGASWNTGCGLKVSIFDNYFGEPEENAGKVLNPAATAVNLASVSLVYAVRTLRSLELSLFVQNALDADYYYPEFSKNWVNTVPLEPGRAVYGMVTYRL